MQWTEEQIIGIAPDTSSLKSGKELAKTSKWLVAQQSERALWGECQGSGKDPYQTAIDLTNIAFKCSCPSKKFPCKHGLGLFFLYAKESTFFTTQDEPSWVSDWLNKRIAKSQQKNESKAESNSPVDAKAQAKRADARLKKVNAGIEELQLWIKDLIHNGLISAPEKEEDFWENTAARMVDAQAGGLAMLIRSLKDINYFSDQWQSELFQKICKLFLITESYKNIDNLPPNLQADIRNLIGWVQSQDELKSQQGIEDTWLILGKQESVEDRLTVQKNWLYGLQSKQYALILNFSHQTQQKDISLLAGTAIEAEIVFFQSNYPQRAIIKNRQATKSFEKPTFFKDWASVQDFYASVIALQPWIEDLPLLVQQITPMLYEDHWFLRDINQQYVTIGAYKDDLMWQLLASSGGYPLDLFVIKEGDTYTPLGFWDKDKYITLHYKSEAY